MLSHHDGQYSARIRALPPEVLAEYRSQAKEWMQANGSAPSSHAGALLVVILWLGSGVAAWLWFKQPLQGDDSEANGAVRWLTRRP